MKSKASKSQQARNIYISNSVHCLEITSFSVPIWSLKTDVGTFTCYICIAIQWCSFIMETIVIRNISNFSGGSKWLNYRLPGGGRDGSFCSIQTFVQVFVCLQTRLGIQGISLGTLFQHHLHGLHRNVMIMTLRAPDQFQKIWG